MYRKFSKKKNKQNANATGLRSTKKYIAKSKGTNHCSIVPPHMPIHGPTHPNSKWPPFVNHKVGIVDKEKAASIARRVGEEHP